MEFFCVQDFDNIGSESSNKSMNFSHCFIFWDSSRSRCLFDKAKFNAIIFLYI